jgi:hypothetical protein
MLQPAPHAAPAAASPARFTEPPQVYQRRQLASTPAPAPLPVSRTTSCSIEPPQVSHQRQVTPAPASSRAGPPVYHLVPVVHDPCRTYPMVTRRAAGITKPVDLLQLSAATSPMLSPVPTSVCRALANPHWRCAMEEEYEALLSNRTWDLVPRPPGANVVTDKWIFKHKLKADGSLDRYKARWVLWGFTQRPGVDF